MESNLLLSRKNQLKKIHKSTRVFLFHFSLFHPRKINEPRTEISFKKNVEKSRSWLHAF